MLSLQSLNKVSEYPCLGLRFLISVDWSDWGARVGPKTFPVFPEKGRFSDNSGLRIRRFPMEEEELAAMRLLFLLKLVARLSNSDGL